MLNCPVQLVMNPSEFLTDDEKPRPHGNYRDYYQGRDSEFIAHKEYFTRQLDMFESVQNENPYTRIAYAKVKLEKKAIAKSNHPTEKLITERNGCKVMGGMKRDEMLVRFSPDSVRKIKRTAMKAEDDTRLEDDASRPGRKIAKPTRYRSELGAIKDVMPLTPEDKCLFTAEDVARHVREYGQGYIYVELFETPLNSDLFEDEMCANKQEAQRMFDTFLEGLKQVTGVRAYHSEMSTAATSLVVYMTDEKNAVVQLNEGIVTSGAQVQKASANPEDYGRLLDFLTSHPVVKRVTMSPIVQGVPKPSFRYNKTQRAVISKPEDLGRYPLVGIADTGIADILNDWVEGRVDNINPRYKDASHGTFIGGLYITGGALNSFIKERDGNRLVEICVLPEENSFYKVYPKGMDEFLFNLRLSIEEARETTGVRVIGLSMNIEGTRLEEEYSPFAKELDLMADELDVILVISAGNLIVSHRDWDETDEDANITEFTSRKDDIVYAPAESLRNISVGALNPPDSLGLTNYTCKGKGLATATKPDLVHVGGFGFDLPTIGTGLYSITETGMITDDCGTSYAAPMVAKTIAALDYMIEGDIPRETLMALAIHHAVVPERFRHKKYLPYLKDWIGFGMPTDSETILNGDEHSISLVFHHTIQKGKKYSFPFSWPKCLIKNGRCCGHVKVTMVSAPRLDYNYHEELVREDISVSLHQVDENEKNLATILKPIFHVAKGKEERIARDEEDLRESYFKWNPIKVYDIDIPKGYSVDAGSWKLEARYQDRDSTPRSEQGVDFTIILTISDPKNEEPVYNEVRQALEMTGVHINDIKTALRIQPRI